jgi:thioredoxin-like negative regulator of GroEL
LIWGRSQKAAAPEALVGLTELADPADISAYISSTKKTVVFFEMTFCPYCVAYKTRFADLVRERSADLDFLRVKLDDPGNPLWSRYGIHAVPTVIAFAAGEIVARSDSILAFGLSRRKWADFCAQI